jgi:hypothetical protein
MKRRLASLFLLLVLTGGVFAGVPLRFGESECSMGGMTDMDCCKAALMQRDTPEVAGAKLCCVLSCAQNGTTSPLSVARVTPPSPALPSLHPAITQPLPNLSLLFRRIDHFHGPPATGPTYLRNLALLI